MYVPDMLLHFDIIYADPPGRFTQTAKEVAGKVFENFLKMLGKCVIVEETEYLLPDKAKRDETEMEQSTSSTTSSTSEEYMLPESSTVTLNRVPFDIKLKIVMTANEHPNWSFKYLQSRFKQHLHHNSEIARFKKEIITGGTFNDKMDNIKKIVYDRFIETRNQKQLITRRQLQQWAMAAAAQFRNMEEESECAFRFVASPRWLSNFINAYRISNRRVTRYLSKKEIQSPKEILNSAIQFQNLILSISTDYNSEFIINTDQTGCEYRVNVARTYTHTNEKTVELFMGDLNKITHSYTAQYALTQSGILLNKVFVCLQEPGDKFGERVQIEVDKLLQLCKNVVVVCSKSGKLTSYLYDQFLKTILKPYVGNNPFLLIVDSWGGQKNINMYNANFINDENRPTCNLQFIPPKCTPICQPCDVYFFRQVKIIIKRIQNCPDILIDGEKKELNSRYDAIRIQSLTHYLLCAPKFKNMIQFAWYASKLAKERDIFYNVNQLCFPVNVHNYKCWCQKNYSFIKCSWCAFYLCFQCFYVNFHPQHCTAMS